MRRDAEKESSRLADEARRELAAVRKHGAAQVDVVAGQLAAATAALAADGRVDVTARGPARAALYGGQSLLAGLPDLARVDGHTASLHAVWGADGRDRPAG